MKLIAISVLGITIGLVLLWTSRARNEVLPTTGPETTLPEGDLARQGREIREAREAKETQEKQRVEAETIRQKAQEARVVAEINRNKILAEAEAKAERARVAETEKQVREEQSRQDLAEAARKRAAPVTKRGSEGWFTVAEMQQGLIGSPSKLKGKILQVLDEGRMLMYVEDWKEDRKETRAPSRPAPRRNAVLVGSVEAITRMEDYQTMLATSAPNRATADKEVSFTGGGLVVLVRVPTAPFVDGQVLAFDHQHQRVLWTPITKDRWLQATGTTTYKTITGTTKKVFVLEVVDLND